MKSIEIEKLLEAYFEGNTSLSEEKILRDYFTSGNVTEDLVQYKSIFTGIKIAAEERSSKVLGFPENNIKPRKTWWYSIAALLVLALGVVSFFLSQSQPQYSQEEKEALAAFEKTKEAMLFLSQNLNKGAEQLTFVDQFGITKDKIFE